MVNSTNTGVLLACQGCFLALYTRLQLGEEYARYFIDENEELPDLDDSFFAAYWIFDYAAFTKDLISGQDIVEIAHDLWVTNNLDF